MKNQIKYIVRKVPERDISDLIKGIPGLIVAKDTTRNAMDTFLLALEVAGDSACVHFEDDAFLCEDFLERLHAEIAKRPNEVIQFFSARKDDERIGSRYISGRAFSYAICFYLPEGYSKEIRKYAKTWRRIKEHPTGLDFMVADYMGDLKIRYWNVVPSLVDHKVGKSAINPRRSSRRQSLTFERNDQAGLPGTKNTPLSEQRCRICGCTWNNACPGGCYWVEKDLCSQCHENP